MNSNVSNAVNSVIMLAAPVDRPVVNMDFYFESFYRKIDQFWNANRREVHEATNVTNTCCANGKLDNVAVRHVQKPKLSDLLLITIGGGEQDLLVQSGLTHSKFSDIHALVCF